MGKLLNILHPKLRWNESPSLLLIDHIFQRACIWLSCVKTLLFVVYSNATLLFINLH